MRQQEKNPIEEIIEAKVFLAPMSGVTDMPFRLMARKYGCKFAFTEMIDVNGIFYKNLKTIKMLDSVPEDKPLGVQLVGQDIEKIVLAAKVCEEKGYGVLDLNSGCPARKVICAGKGSALMKDLTQFGSIVRNLVKVLSIPVTVKIRSGWDNENVNCVEAAQVAESEGASAICVHSRTREAMYKGKPDHELTRLVKEAVKIPVFASGNIFTPKDVSSVFDLTGCDAVSVARGAFGCPWIFNDIYRFLFDGTMNPPLSFDDTKKVMQEHFALCFMYNEKARVFTRMYKHVCWYLKRFKNLNDIMGKYPRSNDPEEMKKFIDDLRIDDRNGLYSENKGAVCAK
jgi:tRNA-dihydrouridine synthase B